MRWNNIKKTVLTICVIIFVTIFLSILQYVIHYYNHPVTKDFSISTTGCLITNTDPSSYEIVNVYVKGKTLHYVFSNQVDAIQGNVWVNETKVLEKSKNNFDFYGEFHEDSPYTCVMIGGDQLGNMITVSDDGKTIVCGLTGKTNVGRNAKMQANTQENALESSKANVQVDAQALLIIPANSYDTACAIIKDVSSNSSQLNSWLEEIEWYKYIEENH